MRSELRDYLDGNLAYEDLPRELRAEATAWDAMIGELRRKDPGGAPPWLESAVMAEVTRSPDPSPVRRLLDWILRPRTVRVSPLAGALAAGALAAVIVLARVTAPTGQGGEAPGTQVYVAFSLEAPGAASVAVAGDFSQWEAAHPLEDADGDGIWTGRVPVRPGVHQYMFVVDGDWVTDPEAQRYVDDGFGNRNAVLAVALPDAGSEI